MFICADNCNVALVRYIANCFGNERIICSLVYGFRLRTSFCKFFLQFWRIVFQVLSMWRCQTCETSICIPGQCDRGLNLTIFHFTLKNVTDENHSYADITAIKLISLRELWFKTNFILIVIENNEGWIQCSYVMQSNFILDDCEMVLLLSFPWPQWLVEDGLFSLHYSDWQSYYFLWSLLLMQFVQDLQCT